MIMNRLQRQRGTNFMLLEVLFYTLTLSFPRALPSNDLETLVSVLLLDLPHIVVVAADK